MNIQQRTIDRLHNIVKGFRVGDVVTARTLDGTHPYTRLFVRRGHLVRVVRGKYRVLRDMPEEAVKGVIELYNLSQNKRREIPEKKSSGTADSERSRRTRQSIVDAVYDKVKSLRDGDHVLVNSLGTSNIMRKRLLKAKLVRRRGAKRAAGCEWIGGVITKEDLAAVMFGKRRPYKRHAKATAKVIAKPSFRHVLDAGPELVDEVMAHRENGHSASDSPLTIESNGFHITLNKGTITISR